SEMVGGGSDMRGSQATRAHPTTHPHRHGDPRRVPKPPRDELRTAEPRSAHAIDRASLLTSPRPGGDPRAAPVRAHQPLRLLLALVVTELALATVAGAPARAGGPPRIEDVEDSLAHDRSYKVRVDAALILGRLRQT